MSTLKKLISFNTVKHPEVANFFSELEDTNLTSHYVREAIKFYEQYKNQVTTTINLPTVQVEPTTQPVVQTEALKNVTSEKPVQEKTTQNKHQVTPADSQDEFVDFDPTKI